MKKLQIPICLLLLIFFSITSFSVDSSNTPKKQSKTKEKFIKIGEQKWLAYNLNVLTFRNGEKIPVAKTELEWEDAAKNGKPAICYYGNNTNSQGGILYNWYAVNDPRGIVPLGNHIPTKDDFEKLELFLGRNSGEALKSRTGWKFKNGTNSSGFNGIPTGYRAFNGKFDGKGYVATYWSSTTKDKNHAFSFSIIGKVNVIDISNHSKGYGLLIRCIKD